MHHSGTSAEKPFPAANGSGVGALDYDLDGNCDLYFLTGTDLPVDPAQSRFTNRLYRNLGEWNFVDVSAASGLDHNGFSAGVAVGDFDSDGFPDVYLACYGPDVLFQNSGDGTFRRVDREAGIDCDLWGTSAAFLDYDEDGLLDIYVCNYADWSLETNQFCGDPDRGVRIFCHPRSVAPVRDVLYRNEGDGTFHDTTEEAGVADRLGRGQGVVAADVSGDGRTDLYVANDANANFLFLNVGDGRFEDATERSGAAYDAYGNAQAGMGVDAADVDRDGRLDLFVTNYEKEYNTLYRNSGDGFFQDVSTARGVGTPSLPWVGWGAVFADFELDGRMDLLLTNGHTDDNLHELGRDSQFLQPAQYFRNIGGRFQLVASDSETYFSGLHAGRSLAVADLDNDGDLDAVIGHLDASPALLRNETRSGTSSDPGSVCLKLIGTRSNRDAVGARVSVHDAEPPRIWQIKGGSSYLSAHDLRLVIATLDHSGPLVVNVTWPGSETAMPITVPGRGSYLLVEPASSDQPPRLLRAAVSEEN